MYIYIPLYSKGNSNDNVNGVIRQEDKQLNCVPGNLLKVAKPTHTHQGPVKETHIDTGRAFNIKVSTFNISYCSGNV